VADAKRSGFLRQEIPQRKTRDFVNGPYALDEDMRRQWEEKEQFPPYEFSLEMGKEMFAKPFRNGKRYADCFPNQGIGIRPQLSYFDGNEGKVISLELALNTGARPTVRRLSLCDDEMAALTAFMAFTSRGRPLTSRFPTIRVRLRPTRTASAISIRGAASSTSPGTCHVQNPESGMRAEILAPALASSMRCRSTVPNGWHGNDQPALHHLQQPNSRRTARSAR